MLVEPLFLWPLRIAARKLAETTGSGANGGPIRSPPEAEGPTSVKRPCVRHENDNSGNTGSIGHEHLHMEDLRREKRDEQEMDVDDNRHRIFNKFRVSCFSCLSQFYIVYVFSCFNVFCVCIVYL